MLLNLLLVALFAVPQGQGGQDRNGSGAPPQTGQAPTQFEQFVDRLKLDHKTQEPEVVQIFTASAVEAGPVALEMLQLRQRLLALEAAGKSDGRTPLLDAYTTAAAKMTAIEIRAFQKVQALLKPSQQSKAADAFVLMAGIFSPPTPRAGAGTRRGRGGE